MLLYFSNKIKRTVLCVSIFTLSACGDQMTSHVTVSQKHFKVQTSFIIGDRGILINTYWGTERKHYVLCLDNFSPSWIKSSLVHYNPSFIKSNNVNFKTYTADGSPIEGNVGVCNSLSFENISFKNVPFYLMPDDRNDIKTDDGVFGIEAMSKGVWKFDFIKNQLEFASDIDSFKEINESEIFPVIFNRQSISVKVSFGSNDVKKMYVDLGYNGMMTMPLNEFKTISKTSQTFTDTSKFITPASQNLLNTVTFFDTVTINHNYFTTLVSSNEKVQEHLIGLSFFKKFNYVIFDFINKRIYIPKKVW